VLRDYGPLLDELRGVTWPARRAARFGSAGIHPSRLRGTSAEFTEYRPYRQGDEPRRLDWKLLARTDRAYLRVTSDRSTLGTVVVVDASASMAFPEERPAGARGRPPAATFGKWRQACRVAVGLAAVAHAGGDPVGVLVVGAPGEVMVAPRTRRGVIAEIARALDAVIPGVAGTGAPLTPALAALRAVPRIAIVSDFLDQEDDALALARTRLVAGGEVVAIAIVAAEELNPAARPMTAVDPERPALRRPLVEATRTAYLEAFGSWRAGLSRGWRAAGATFAEVVTSEPAARAVRRIAGGGAAR